MYTQQPNMFQHQQSQVQHLHLNEQDVAGLVLSELKRTAGEYTTAIVESSHPDIRQQFTGLLQKTLQDQAELFQVMSQMNSYSSIKMASGQEIQQELQQQIRKSEELRGMVRQSVQGAFSGGSTYQQPFEQQRAFHGYSPSQTGFQTGYSGFDQSHGIPSVSSSAMSPYGSGQGFGASYGSESPYASQHQAASGQGMAASSGQAISSSLSSSIQPSASHSYGAYSSREEDQGSKSARSSSETSGLTSEPSGSNKSLAASHTRENSSNKYVF